MPNSLSRINPQWLEEEEDETGEGGEGGEGGGIAGTGTGEPVIDPALFGLTNTALKRRMREFEKKFGLPPFTQDKPEHSPGLGMGEGLMSHPLLDQSQQFSGIDPKLNNNPVENPDAQRNYDELQNRLALAPGKKQRFQKQKGMAAPSLRRQ